MSALIRDAPLGQIIRWVTKNRVLQYPEEKADFQCPESYAHPDRPREEPQEEPEVEPEGEPTEEVVPMAPEDVLELEKSKTAGSDVEGDNTFNIEKIRTAATQRTSRTGLSRVGTRGALQKSVTRADLEEQFTLATLEKGPTRPIEPEKLEDGTILVDWYTTDDPDNPQNWSFGKKAFVAFQI